MVKIFKKSIDKISGLLGKKPPIDKMTKKEIEAELNKLEELRKHKQEKNPRKRVMRTNRENDLLEALGKFKLRF